MLMLGANLVWAAYNSLLLPTLVEKVVTTGKGLVVGLIGFFGTLLAITVSILAGIISDHTASRWGRRTPAILIGALDRPAADRAARAFPGPSPESRFSFPWHCRSSS